MELILGTAEFNPEGYAGKPPIDFKEKLRILNLAWEAGIRTLDTAEAYESADLLSNYGDTFRWIQKTRDIAPSKAAYFYHYTQEEKRIPGVKNASIYTEEQRQGLEREIVPLNINNTAFAHRSEYFSVRYARSVFDRGRLLEQGWSVKDCLLFVKRQDVDGVIVGVNCVNELEEILSAWT